MFLAVRPIYNTHNKNSRFEFFDFTGIIKNLNSRLMSVFHKISAKEYISVLTVNIFRSVVGELYYWKLF